MAQMDTNGHLQGKLTVLVGGGGFLGLRLAQQLLEQGSRLRIASRNPERSLRAKPLGELGDVQPVRCDVTKPQSLTPVMAGADAVVNLVGAFTGDLDALMGKGAGDVAAAAQRAGAGAFVQVSAIGADREGDTAYARAKAAGEAAVREAFSSATIIRPSALFGPDDHFINLFASLIATFPVMPVFAPDSKLQPLLVDDAALGIVGALSDPQRHGGKIFEIAGPEAITVLDLNRRIAAAAMRRRIFIPLPNTISAAFATLTGGLPGAPLTRQQWRLLRHGNMVSGRFPGLTELGISPRPLELFLDRWMERYRKHGRFGRGSLRR